MRKKRSIVTRRPRVCCGWIRTQMAVFEHQLIVRRNDVDRGSQHLDRAGHLRHRHGGFLLEDGGEVALVLRREMHDDDKGEAAVGRHVGEKLLERRDPAGGSAEADDGGGFVRVEPFSGRRCARSRSSPRSRRGRSGWQWSQTWNALGLAQLTREMPIFPSETQLAGRLVRTILLCTLRAASVKKGCSVAHFCRTVPRYGRT